MFSFLIGSHIQAQLRQNLQPTASNRFNHFHMLFRGTISRIQPSWEAADSPAAGEQEPHGCWATLEVGVEDGSGWDYWSWIPWFFQYVSHLTIKIIKTSHFSHYFLILFGKIMKNLRHDFPSILHHFTIIPAFYHGFPQVPPTTRPSAARMGPAATFGGDHPGRLWSFKWWE